MGVVYRARDTRLDRNVALKLLAPRVAGDRSFRERFDREAKVISSLDHPHICALHDMGEHVGIHFLVMQYLEGGRWPSVEEASAKQQGPAFLVLALKGL